MRIGIFFGGASREREVSFAGGRTVLDTLDQSLFEAVPIFVDSTGCFIRLEWNYLYKGSIRDFYPYTAPEPQTRVAPYIEQLQEAADFQQLRDQAIARIGVPIAPSQLAEYIDFAFLVLHGHRGEDGSIQGLLEYLDIPYSGSGILPSALGLDKSVQRRLMQTSDFDTPPSVSIAYADWLHTDYRKNIFLEINRELQFPVVVKSATQGSSIGISFLHSNLYQAFEEAIDRSFFIDHIYASDWQAMDAEARIHGVREITDLQHGLGLPLIADRSQVLYRADAVLDYLNEHLARRDSVRLEAMQGERRVVVEEMIQGQEFSCIVLRDFDGTPVALPPTGILKSGELFDYRAKYLPGISRKETPMNASSETLQHIREECERLFRFLDLQTYARIDGFVSETGSVYLNDPNTTSGMLPSSFFFHQAAEIGLTPTQLITYIIYFSLLERRNDGMNRVLIRQHLKQLDHQLQEAQSQRDQRERLGVIMGGHSFERHISVESGRNVYQKLAASGAYEVKPIFLSEDEEGLLFYELPVNLLLKDNADDILGKLQSGDQGEDLSWIRREAAPLLEYFGDTQTRFRPKKMRMEQLVQNLDFAFLALHGRPGEDGTLQHMLESYDMPYNGSGPGSAAVTIDKHRTNQILREAGFQVADQYVVDRPSWQADPDGVAVAVEKQLGLPLILKPVDDGCSAAVMRIDNRSELMAYAEAIFRDEAPIPDHACERLHVRRNDEFPRKDHFLAENLIDRRGARHFLEITGGMLIGLDDHGRMHYEVFEPSEAVAGSQILSLEEKFLAGEGQNITPARFAPEDAQRQLTISRQVKDQLRRVAEYLEVYGYCRIDAFVRIDDADQVEVIIIEVNALPGLTPATAIFHQAALQGYAPLAFLEAVIENGKARSNIRIE